MPRRREIPKREILPDPKYSSGDVAKFVNVLMSRGKKSVAERIVYGAFESIAKKGGKDPLVKFKEALWTTGGDAQSRFYHHNMAELLSGRAAA